MAKEYAWIVRVVALKTEKGQVRSYSMKEVMQDVEATMNKRAAQGYEVNSWGFHYIPGYSAFEALVLMQRDKEQYIKARLAGKDEQKTQRLLELYKRYPELVELHLGWGRSQGDVTEAVSEVLDKLDRDPESLPPSAQMTAEQYEEARKWVQGVRGKGAPEIRVRNLLKRNKLYAREDVVWSLAKGLHIRGLGKRSLLILQESMGM